MITLDPIASTKTVERPKNNSEFAVQAYLYSELLNAGIDVFGEVNAIYGDKTAQTRNTAGLPR